MYQPRRYRNWIIKKDLVSFNATLRETDLQIYACKQLKAAALQSIKKHRRLLEKYIREHPLFLGALQPQEVEEDAPPIIREMAEAGRRAGVGPMAAVAGALAEAVGRDLLELSPEVIVENGGDIFLSILRERQVGIYAGESSPFTAKLGLSIPAQNTPLGICTSSGTVGHSLSFGCADAVIVLACPAALADAAATAIGNNIKEAADIDAEIEGAGRRYGISGLVIIKGEKIGIWGDIKLVS
ncbi:MAG TPA: UPF0280 family protein [Dehalococcoidia bacterium]|nr:UPF0280 family protein [Dehalococcoidia bacterium]